MARDSKRSGSKLGVDRWKESEAGTSGGDKASRKLRGEGRRRAEKGSRARGKMSPKARRYLSTLVVLLVVLVVSVIGFTPVNERITQGLDIRGGVSVIMRASTSDGSTPSASDMATATTIVQSLCSSRARTPS